MLAAAYDFLRAAQPFSAWRLPDSDELGFAVIRDKTIYADTNRSASYFLPLPDPKPSLVPANPGPRLTDGVVPQSRSEVQGIIPVPDDAGQKLNNDPSGSSAALLDPSAFQLPDPRVLAPAPLGAVTLTTPDNSPFYAPAGTDFNDVYKAAQKVRGKPCSDRLEAVYGALKHDGTYDYQRQDKTFNGNYRRASNFAVGVYMNGAGFSLPETWALSSMYALGHGRPDIIPEDESWWRSGYDAADAGKLPQGVET